MQGLCDLPYENFNDTAALDCLGPVLELGDKRGLPSRVRQGCFELINRIVGLHVRKATLQIKPHTEMLLKALRCRRRRG